LNNEKTGASLVTTNARHIALTPSHVSHFEDHDSPDQESSPNGNSVALEAEMVKESETQSEFQAAANLYSKALTLMKTAIGH
jgi:flagellar basal-body rod protein FlgB